MVVHNAEKHASATGMDIELREMAGKLILKFKDNGQGFDPKDPAYTEKGLTLKNILSRVETLNGQLLLSSSPQIGTEYLIEIPLQPDENAKTESTARGRS